MKRFESIKNFILFNGKKTLVWICANWPAKVVSVALAFLLMFFHHMSRLETRFISTPLRLELDENLAPANSYPRMIRVSLRGEGASIYPILDDDIETYLDLSQHTLEGTYRAQVQVRKKGAALGVEPLEITVDPMEITLNLDQKTAKYVQLTPNIQGYPQEGYELVSYTLTPNQVMVDGPRRLVQNLTELTTETIEIGGRSDDFTVTARIMNRDPLVVIRGEGSSEFQGFIKNLIMIRSFGGLAIELRGLGPGLSAQADISAGVLRLEGAQNVLAPYEPQGVTLYADCSAITQPGTYSLPLQASGVPQAFTLIRSEPSQINLEVILAREHNEDET